jgi:hypothetical protein
VRCQRGQTAAEYVGVLLVVSVIIAAVSNTTVGTSIARHLDRMVCEIFDGEGCATPKASAGRPGDRDGDGVSDRDERRAGTDPRSADSDRDGISDGRERRLGTDPLAADSDGDGIGDRREAGSGGKLDPTKGDTDGDGLSDAEEVAIGTDPSTADGDGEFGAARDGLSDAKEVELGTDPNAYDTDGDGNPDGYEVERGDDPTEDERNLITKGFETFVLDDPIGALVTLGAGKLASGAAKVLAGRVRALHKALRGAKSVQEAARIRRQIIAVIRDKLGRYTPGNSLGRVPQGIAKAEFDDAARLIRAQAGSISDDIRIHGSRARGTARPDSDLDVAILVDDAQFDDLARKAWGRPNPGSSKEGSLNYALEHGKIPSGEAGLRALRKELQRRLGKDVHVSIIRRGSAYDQGPYIPIP